MSKNLDLTQLREIAEQATPGPWQWGAETIHWGDCGPNLETVERGPVYHDGSQGAAVEIIGSWGHDASGVVVEDHDKEFIAAFDPPTVLALIARAEAAEQAVARVREIAKADLKCPCCSGYEEILRALDGDTRD